MSDSKGKLTEIKAKQNGRERKSGYVNWWLFRTKGTVAEPWSSAEELWNNPDIQEEIQYHNNLVRSKNGS